MAPVGTFVMHKEDTGVKDKKYCTTVDKKQLPCTILIFEDDWESPPSSIETKIDEISGDKSYKRQSKRWNRKRRNKAVKRLSITLKFVEGKLRLCHRNRARG